jgi:3-hydroxyethyl bacteriochlorophyllide a dehydrogenase
MQAHAVIFKEPGCLAVDRVELTDPGVDDLVIESVWSGISSGTERLLWSGDMPAFPGMGYPLVPGYETVGKIVEASGQHSHRIGEQVYVPGSSSYKDVRGLFGGTASTLVVPESKAYRVEESWKSDSVLMALAATAHHALTNNASSLPDLVVGHGVLGRLIARIAIALGADNIKVWDTSSHRRDAQDYSVIDPSEDEGSRYSHIVDVTGDADILDQLIAHLNPNGEITLAGFYSQRVSFAFPSAFMKEARIRVAAEWKPEDMDAVLKLLGEGRLSLAGLVSHHMPTGDAQAAYEAAFGDPSCLKMVLNWRELS